MQITELPPTIPVEFSKNCTVGLVYAGLSHLGAEEENHSKLVRSSLRGALEELSTLGVSKLEQIKAVECPGVLEIPLTAKKLIQTHDLDGVVAFALVVDGGIYRHEFVAQTSLDLLMSVSVDLEVPIASCILTPAEPKSPEKQFDFLSEHLYGKGKECASALVKQMFTLSSL